MRSDDDSQINDDKEERQELVLKRMEEFTSTSGPLFMLKQFREEKTRVKVWTRGVAGVRGVTSGFIAAFDKVRFYDRYLKTRNI